MGEASVIDAKEVEHGGVEVVDGDGVFNSGVAEFISGAIGEAFFDAAASEPDGEAFIVMVATGGTFVGLGHGGAAKFTGPDDQGFLEHAALAEVTDKSGTGPVGFEGFPGQVFAQPVVVVPITMVKLDETDAAFGEAAGEEAVRGEGAIAGGAAVFLKDAHWLSGNVHEFGDAGLHLVSHLVLGDAGGDFRIVHDVIVMGVDGIDGANEVALLRTAEAGRALEVENGIALPAELDALVAAGEKTGGPLTHGNGLGRTSAAVRDEHDEARQVFGFGAETVRDPRTHGGTTDDLGAGVHEGVGGVVVDRVGGHRADDAEFVCDGADVREKLGDFSAALAEALEGGLGRPTNELLALELGELLAGGEALGHGLAIHAREAGLVIKGFELAWSPRHGKPDDAADFGWMMRWMNECLGGSSGADERRLEQAREGHGTKGAPCPAEEDPAGLLLPRELCEFRFHRGETSIRLARGKSKRQMTTASRCEIASS